FFQAEDGIRDLTVTGVQTCALPIYALPEEALETLDARAALGLIGRLERVGRRDRARRRGQVPRGLAVGAHPSCRRVRGVPAGAHPKASWRAAPAARATGRSPSA